MGAPVSRDEPFGPETVAADPIEQFRAWFDEAKEAGEAEPEAMSVATVGPDGRPSSRFVLLRGVEADGFVFFTNRTSRKGGEIEAHPAVALAWRWALQDRQVRVTGVARRADDAVSDAYHASRARRSQLGAWASRQSTLLPDRATLEQAVADTETRFAGQPVPRPPFWGGYLVVPDEVEFWQGRANRLHDRARYRRHDDGWVVERLSP